MRWRVWISDRFGLDAIRHTVLERKVPKSPWYYGDGASLLILFVVLVVTGMAMSLTYSPSLEGAYKSVTYITHHQPLGWFVRGLHYWSAGAMMVMIWFHVFRVLAVGGYKAPREGIWLTGVLLLFAVFVMGFIGYLLRWDERAVYAFTLVLHMYQKVPFIGDWLVRFVQGGEEIGGQTLPRLYAVHVLIVPSVMVLLIGWHVYLVIHHGITSQEELARPLPSREDQRVVHALAEKRGEPFYPATTAKSGLMGMVIVLLAAGLTLFLGPLPMYPEANLVDPSMPQGEWWWWWYSGAIGLIGHPIASWFIVLFPPLLFVGLIALPFLDRGPERNIMRRPIMATAMGLSIAIIALGSVMRWHSPWTGWPTDELPPVPEGVALNPQAEQGRVLFTRFGCSSCHAVGDHGAHVGPDLTTIGSDHSAAELRRAIVQPPDESAMPDDYGRRMTDQQLDQVVEFLLHLR